MCGTNNRIEAYFNKIYVVGRIASFGAGSFPFELIPNKNDVYLTPAPTLIKVKEIELAVLEPRFPHNPLIDI